MLIFIEKEIYFNPRELIFSKSKISSETIWKAYLIHRNNYFDIFFICTILI